MKPEVRRARRAGLPTAGELRGVITVVQETRFRLEDERGRGYLFTLAPQAGASMTDLHRWNASRLPVRVVYQGPPDLGATALTVDLAER